ncbi:MAG TPA: HlyD family efflux transporter periplasmic adaptor subunit [Burkholderiales bacterium]|nr:HlyD family efflux transporter periplasmic adaptor subunit [Burkholderiales bacterium]
MNTKSRKWILVAVLSVAAAGAGIAWWWLRPAPLPPGFAVGNGRIEATQIDIATKLAGRIKEVLVNEGDFVEAEQVVARMDTQVLEAELRQAEAQVSQARNAVDTAKAVVAQRESELTFAQNTLKRSEDLVQKGFISPQKLDADRMAMQTAKAGLVAARSLVVQAQSAIDAAQATAERIKADLDDSVLKAPRAGRIQYRLAEPGEVLPAGGKVVSMLDLSDVYMTVFLPEITAGRLAIGAPARIVLDLAPQYVIPAKVSFVAAEAQFTPKTVETTAERQKLVFRVKAQIDPELLRKYRTRVKAGLPGLTYVQVNPNAPWPANLEVKLPPT